MVKGQMFHQCSITIWCDRKEESLQVLDLQGFTLEGALQPTHKKRHCLSAMSPFGVPGRTRTVDIQNHKQVVELPRIPVFIGISALLHFAFAPILRRISAEL